MITEDKVTEIFCMIDYFCEFFDAMIAKYTLKSFIGWEHRAGEHAGSPLHVQPKHVQPKHINRNVFIQNMFA